MANTKQNLISNLSSTRKRKNIFAFAWLFAAIFLSLSALPNKAIAQTKSLKLYFLHTGEKNTITYYKNGKYLAAGLKKINWAVRDWRRNEPTKMDPKLLDLIWEAYRRSGSKDYIHVVSGYRSPKTNEALRKRGGGQAKKSQHTLGKALDFFLPDVKISKLRDIGLKMGVGGVGYYPRSGSPFVHFDTGSVRHWPRMNRKQLVAVFPDGKTMHVPTDGKPLSKYKVAVAEYKRRKASGKTVPTTTKKELNLFQRIAANTRADEEEDKAQSSSLPRAVKSVKAPTIKPPTVKPVVGTGGSPVEVEKPLSITAPKPSAPIQKIEPEQDPFTLLANKQIPVPELSPRSTLVASLEPQVESPKEVERTEPPVLEPVENEPTPEVETPILVAEAGSNEVTDTSSAENAFSIPVPTERPQVSSEPASDATIVVASLETNQNAAQSTNEEVLPLTPNDITKLRQQTKQNETDAAEQEVVPIVEPINNANEAIEIAAPTLKPELPAESQPTEPTTTLALAPESTQKIAPLSAEQAFEDALNAIKPEMEINEVGAPIDIANNSNIPLPTPNPRFVERAANNAPAIEVAKLEQNNTVETLINNTPDNPIKIENNSQLGNRTVSLDKLSAPQDNSSQIGRYAMASNVSIEEISDVQAPAYGRNVIRTAPASVFKEGFRNNIVLTNARSFSGKAIVFKEFATLSQLVR